MKKSLMVALALMSILTVVYIGAVVYANTNYDGFKEIVLAAEELETQPSSWYTPEELGIISIAEKQGFPGLLSIGVPPEKDWERLQGEQPVFKYKDEFYQILPVWVDTIYIPHPVLQYKIPIGAAVGTGWILIGALIFREKRKIR